MVKHGWLIQIDQSKGSFKMVKDLIDRLNKYCAEKKYVVWKRTNLQKNSKEN